MSSSRIKSPAITAGLKCNHDMTSTNNYITASIIDIEFAFLEAMQSEYGKLDFTPEADSNIHRFHVPGDRSNSRNGWYVLFPEGIASGCFGSWKSGLSRTWCIRKPADPLEAQLVAQRNEQTRRRREAEQHRRQQMTAERARREYHDARPANTDFPYLIGKQIRLHNARQSCGKLLIPLYHAGELVNLQRISQDGEKRFAAGGQVKGAYSPIGTVQPGKPLYVCEGWATGATLHESTGAPVACAMNAGNLLPVARHLKQRYPGALLIIAGDDDRQTEGNPGRTAATAAAIATGSLVAFPEWPTDAPLDLTDFNDLATWRAAHACS